MAPAPPVNLSPAELSYMYTSLSQTPPIRPDGRTPTQFRQLIAETDVLPTTNGSARICFADGSEAIVGVKAAVEQSTASEGEPEPEPEPEPGLQGADLGPSDASERDGDGEAWVQIAIEIPGHQADDSLPVFLAAMLTEALLADGTLKGRLRINSRFHWLLHIDILLLSPPLAYPLPLLSLTTHLALLQTRLPALVSEKDEDPMFDDDWAASTPLYTTDSSRPPVTLLLICVGENTLFDAAREELAVADYVLAVSVCERHGPELSVLSMRAIDPPARMSNPGVPDALNPVTGGAAPDGRVEAQAMREMDRTGNVWRLPRGGIKRSRLSGIIRDVVRADGVGHEVLEALRALMNDES